MKNKDYFKNKSVSEIKRAAKLWFLCQESCLKGDIPPMGVFLISTDDLTNKEKKHGLEVYRKFKHIIENNEKI